MDLKIYDQSNTPVFSTSNFKAIGVGKGGNVWAGTANLGLYKYNGTIWEKCPALTNNNINDIKTDRTGGIWVGQSGNTGGQALNGGINYFPNADFNYTFYTTQLGLPTRYVKSLYINNFDNSTQGLGEVWSAHLANVTGGVSTTGAIGRGIYITSPFVKITQGVDISNGLGSCQSIGGNSNEVWAFASVNFGHSQILRYNYSNSSFIGYFDDTNTPLPAGFTVRSIYFDSKNRVWIGMLNGGVYVYDNGLWQQLSVPTILTSTTNVNFNAITGDSHGYLYIGTSSGLVVYNGGDYNQANTFALYTTINGLPSDNIQGIAVDNMNNTAYNILLATANGIVKWKQDGFVFYHVHNHDFEKRDSIDVENIKVAADSSSETLIKIKIPNAQQCILRVKEDLGPIFNKQDYGYFILYKSYADSILYQYHHPSNTNFGTDPYSRTIHFEVYNTSENLVKLTEEVKVVRPPLLLAHGVFGTGESTFGNMRRKLISDRLYTSGQITAIDYPNDRDFIFAVNVLRVKKDAALRNALLYEKILCSKIDVAGHSMGGLILRKYLHSSKYNNDINKYISFNTPHSGSQIADFVLKYLPTFLNPVVKYFMGDPLGGALEDLRANSPEVESLNVSNENKVPSHAIETTQTLSSAFFQKVPAFNPQFWLVALLGTKAFSYAYWDGLYDHRSNDIAVEDISQQGGLQLPYYTFIDNQWHGSTSDPNIDVYNEFVRLLNTNPDDINTFTRGGFKPPKLTLPSDLKTPTHVSDASLHITSPTLGSDFQSNSNLNVNFNYSSVDSLILIIGSLTNPINVYQINSPANSISIPIPQNYFGNTEILILGFNQNGYAAMDSVNINISTSATIDSIFSNPESIKVIRTHGALFSTYGLFTDSITRNLTGATGLTYLLKTNKASFQAPNQILGLANGYDTLTISYSGKSVSVPIEILDSSEWINPGDFILSLELINFTASLNTNQIFLNWTSAHEFNSSHFDIERSIDGTKFSKIGSVNAIGNTIAQNDYHFIDNQIPVSSIIYYRLKIVDQDGKFVYSNVIIIRVDNHLINSIIFPNPANNLLNIQLNGYKGKVSFKIFDYQGKKVKEENIVTNGPFTSGLNIKSLPAGIYFVWVGNKDKKEKIPFVKQ